MFYLILLLVVLTGCGGVAADEEVSAKACGLEGEVVHCAIDGACLEYQKAGDVMLGKYDGCLAYEGEWGSGPCDPGPGFVCLYKDQAIYLYEPGESDEIACMDGGGTWCE